MANPIKSNLSSFIDYKEPIYIQWLSFYEATDRKLKEKQIAFLRPDQQLRQRISDAFERVQKFEGTDRYNSEYRTFLHHLRRFVSNEFLSSEDYEITDNDIWIKAGVKMATELVWVRNAMDSQDWPRKFADKDRWRAWLFNTAKNSIDDVLEPIYDALFYKNYHNEIIKIKLSTEFKRDLEVVIDMPRQAALDIIYPFLEKYPSDDEVLDAFTVFAKSERKIQRYLVETIDEQMSISQMSSVKALKRSIATGRKILNS